MQLQSFIQLHDFIHTANFYIIARFGFKLLGLVFLQGFIQLQVKYTIARFTIARFDM